MARAPERDVGRFATGTGATLAAILLARFVDQRRARRLAPPHLGLSGGHHATVALGSAPTVGVSAGVIALVAAVLVLATGAFRRRATPPVTPEPGGSNPGVEQRLVLALDELRAEPDPRPAVLRAYAAFERGAAVPGSVRQLPEAPFEFVERMGMEAATEVRPAGAGRGGPRRWPPRRRGPPRGRPGALGWLSKRRGGGASGRTAP